MTTDSGHYECRPSARVRGLVDVYWVAPQRADQFLNTFSVGHLRLLADAAGNYVREHADPYAAGHPVTGSLAAPAGPDEAVTIADLSAARRRRLIEEW